MPRIIISDEDYLVRKALETIIAKADHFDIVALSSDHRVLPDLCKTHRPDIVITDIVQSGETSLAATKKIREVSPCASVYIVTACNDFEIVQESLKLGVADYILKPFSYERIMRILKKFENQSSELSLAEQVRQLVFQKDFNAVYQSIPRLEQALRGGIVSKKTVSNNGLEQMLEEALKLINCTEKHHKARYFDKFHFSETTLNSRFLTRFLLFDLFEEIYKQRSIQKKPQLAKVFHYLDERVYHDITLREAAVYCGISEGYLSRVLKEHYNLSFNTYVQMKKLQLAKQAFYLNGDKIVDVSFQLSYSEPSYFCKVFKRMEGITPTQLKKQMAMENRKRNE
ncbi:Helix-turn-helix domain-containing protein [Evansella caseinilytica]|uniref:Helix-turn-helix domain-containing protein n=1 Tax=Evansella caseinilytica TaxID=1503961 RepID=A0A1H3HX91_9BACI|nr:response regulator [Evansella caseinilytica]SDY20093.1 Helix-turn-helix domain-containing protein [Evansella caseinilytica]